MNNVSVTRPYRKRRRHAPEFKARLVAECHSPGASVSRIALDNDLDANQLRRWIRESKQTGKSRSPAFMPIKLPAATPVVEKRSTIRIEIPRAGGPVVLEWPVDQAHQCVVLLRNPLQ
jgi:transposase-like protein